MLVNMHDAKSQLSRLVEHAAAGEEVVIARAGRPVARLVAYEAAPARRPGRWRDQVRIPPDFDETPDDVLAAFEDD
jgi:prevent-host-death family protein